MALARHNITDVIKIQALVKGYLVRKANKVSKELADARP